MIVLYQVFWGFTDSWWEKEEKVHLSHLPVSSSSANTSKVSTLVKFLLSHKSQLVTRPMGNKKVCNKQFKAWQCKNEHIISYGQQEEYGHIGDCVTKDFRMVFTVCLSSGMMKNVTDSIVVE